MVDELYKSIKFVTQDILLGDKYELQDKLIQLGMHYKLHLKVLDDNLLLALCKEIFSDTLFNYGRMTALIAFVLVCPTIKDKMTAMDYVSKYIAENHTKAFISYGDITGWINFVHYDT